MDNRERQHAVLHMQAFCFHQPEILPAKCIDHHKVFCDNVTEVVNAKREGPCNFDNPLWDELYGLWGATSLLLRPPPYWRKHDRQPARPKQPKEQPRRSSSLEFSKEQENLFHKATHVSLAQLARHVFTRHYERITSKHRADVTDRDFRYRSGDFSESAWQAMKERYNFTCLRCGKKEPEITLSIDHVIPIAFGGAHTESNIQPLCTICNIKKHTKVTDYRAAATPAP